MVLVVLGLLPARLSYKYGRKRCPILRKRFSEREMAADGGACITCLDASPPPIQSGCACRGDSGLAHIACAGLGPGIRIGVRPPALSPWPPPPLSGADSEDSRAAAGGRPGGSRLLNLTRNCGQRAA